MVFYTMLSGVRVSQEVPYNESGEMSTAHKMQQIADKANKEARDATRQNASAYVPNILEAVESAAEQGNYSHTYTEPNADKEILYVLKDILCIEHGFHVEIRFTNCELEISWDSDVPAPEVNEFWGGLYKLTSPP